MTQKIGVILPLSFGQQPEPPPIWTECRSTVALLRPPVGWLLAARLRNRLGYYYLSSTIVIQNFRTNVDCRKYFSLLNA